VIWLIGHAGHSPPAESNLKLPKLKDNHHLYNLAGQVDHKIDLIDRIPDQIKKIHAIGHSVGSWIIIDLLRKSPKFDQKVQKCYLMFPTVEKIAQSKSGKFFVAARPFFFIVHFFVWLFNCLPHGTREKMVKWYCRGMPEEFHEHCFEHTKPAVVEKVLFMASDEMNQITEIDEEMVRKNMHRLKLYYGSRDAWVRKRFFYDLLERFPEIDAELCTKGYEHAFVLKSGKECGVMVGGWINEHNKIAE
jgi:pimeloyl-ACP methyl ester carboxylesterase